MFFDYTAPNNILFGNGRLAEVGGAAARMGSRALVVSGTTETLLDRLLQLLWASDLETVLWRTGGEPTVDDASKATALARQENCHLVIGFGGGSAIDTGKAVSALLTNTGDLFDYLEVIGRGKIISQPAAPLIAIPTTAGTGAEVTRNAVLGAPDQRVKVSMRSPLMLPRLALVDPELTYDLPPHITASTGLDALTQLIEPFVSIKANPMTDAFCREGLRRAAGALRQAYVQGHDPQARQDMALASLLGGLALANAGLGAVHGFAAPLGGMFSGPHGAICAHLLPYVMEANLRSLNSRQPDSPALPRYAELARILTGDPLARAEAGVTWVGELCAALQVPPLSTYGVTLEDLPVLVEKSAQASSMKANPIKLNPGDLQEILERAL